jgi:hypothetical protein
LFSILFILSLIHELPLLGIHLTLDDLMRLWRRANQAFRLRSAGAALGDYRDMGEYGAVSGFTADNRITSPL